MTKGGETMSEIQPPTWNDGKLRCLWANPKNALYIHYHDHEWGVPVSYTHMTLPTTPYV